MSSANPPLIVIVPGAFGTPDGFNKLLPYLTEAGYTTHPGAYPSCNPSDPTNVSSAQDIAFLRDSVLLPLLNDQGKDVVVLAHSYGGVVAGGAANGLAKGTRQAHGHSTGIVGLIYVAGNITLEGEALLTAVGGVYPPFIKVGTPSEGLAIIEPAMDILYNDCDRALEAELNAFMQPHALRAFEMPATAPAWAESAFDGRRAYVRTLEDCCNPSSLQDAWLEKSKVEWDVVDFQTGHMPFVSQPRALAEQIVRFVEGFGRCDV
ncbi:esterase/lipase family protein [Aspergillus ibericus CBS 121593]|uniref:Alpha/beta-hydrolase n=1 Tax=Aspergillus ibericus CBS 121593 TaxID=1448316 RepID=A0A395GKC1_9EURO|nr:alpha/beta-hydrolase [Aspergillus ibericus CBS 121593]RAK95488.1 alpha/beta-hydrolase [Aspergillus ibericus CBS 121593]